MLNIIQNIIIIKYVIIIFNILIMILNESMALAPYKPQYLHLKCNRRISMNTDHTNLIPLMKRVIISTTIVLLFTTTIFLLHQMHNIIIIL